MDFYDYIINRNAAQEKNPGKLSSYRQAAELICLCWNRLDMSFVEPYLDEDMVWKGGVPYRVINGKVNFLKLMSQVFDSLQYSKRSYRADVDGSGDRSVAIITVDGEYQDMMHRLKIEDGLIKEIEVTPSGYWWSKQFGGSSPFGVVHQTSQHEQAAAVAAIENFVKTELGDKPIIWATQYELRNSCCQLSFSCDGLSYDVLVEIHSFDDKKCRFVMYSEYNGLIAECKENDHIPCILALNEDHEFVSLTLLEDMDVRVQKLRNKGINEWTFRGLFKTKAQLSRLIITKDYRILLPDYNDIEVKMEPLVKAVYLLFLKHPEGILFKGLTDYREEMLDIYKKLKPMELNKRTIQSIEDVTNPLLNSINEKCARIRSAFVKEFDESLAKNYFVTGERGEAKKITLPRDLVNWE
ncbi:nuclear transport factor 2 family protein [Prevotella sp. E9-3]|uniref:nuclear transport factor 2 family protein n=1 Tax=Prevotella sp. E9-3 TaxID=2913621 RepID=UPI001EDC6C1F|nr:nuclear transport factor 2 family protein [Prevotella sp. E9-3]UKK49507.1 nuclear transport factor 2 family protein [Prevotella sp. E9-3]